MWGWEQSKDTFPVPLHLLLHYAPLWPGWHWPWHQVYVSLSILTLFLLSSVWLRKGRDKPVNAIQPPAPSDWVKGNTGFKLVQSKEAKSFVWENGSSPFLWRVQYKDVMSETVAAISNQWQSHGRRQSGKMAISNQWAEPWKKTGENNPREIECSEELLSCVCEKKNPLYFLSQISSDSLISASQSPLTNWLHKVP